MVVQVNQLTLSDLSIEMDDFRGDLNTYLSGQAVWKGQLTTMTSQTLIDLASAVGTFDQARLLRAYEDAFAETAQNEDAIRAITIMQGLRMTRKLPASAYANLTSPVTVTLDPYTQFTVAGSYFFNREQVSLQAGVTLVDVPLYQGKIVSYIMNGLGTEYQAWVSEEDSSEVSDVDVVVRINGVIIPKTAGNMWNYRAQPAWADLTKEDGRLNVQFGNSVFGSVPLIQDVVTISYVLTDGDNSNNTITVAKKVAVNGFSDISGVMTTNPTGGTPITPVAVYKNVASGSFGTNLSAVTRSQYIGIINTYPGIIDAVTQAQREIDPMDLNYMNVFRVSALTSSPWTQQQKQDFISAMQKTSMYSPRFYWVDAIPIDRTIDIDVYAFNTATLSVVEQLSEDAVTALMAPKSGILMTDFFESDLDTAIKNANNGQVSYTIVNSPVAPMYVGSPNAATVTYTINTTGGTLSDLVYSYSVAVSTSLEDGPPNAWIFPQIMSGTTGSITLTWNEVPGAATYRIYGRQGGSIGLITTVAAVPLGPAQVWVDTGAITPTGGLPNTLSLAPIRYNRIASLNIRAHFSNRQRKLDGTPERSNL